MSIAELEQAEGWAASYRSSAFAGWLAGYLAAILIVLAMIISEEAPIDLWSIAMIIPPLLVGGLFLGILVGGPTVLLFAGLMAVAERASAKARGLPAWLGGGLLAWTPLAFGWWLMMQGPGDSTPPDRAVLITFGLIYSVALITSGTAWWARYRSWRI